jgi:hypothetical protein
MIGALAPLAGCCNHWPRTLSSQASRAPSSLSILHSSAMDSNRQPWTRIAHSGTASRPALTKTTAAKSTIPTEMTMG